MVTAAARPERAIREGVRTAGRQRNEEREMHDIDFIDNETVFGI